MSLQVKLEQVLKETTGVTGVAVKHLETGEEAHINGDELFQLASVVKVPILAALYKAAHDGRLRLDERIRLDSKNMVPGSGVLQDLDSGVELSLRDLATLMIIVSDNYATDEVLERVGISETDAYMKELGLHNIHVKHSIWQLLCLCVGIEEEKPFPEGYATFLEKDRNGEFDSNHFALQATPENNAASALDLNHLLEMIYKREIISEAACDGMIDIMLRQKFTNRIPLLLPEYTDVACKSGSAGPAYNDIGIVYLPDQKGAFAISVLTRDTETRTEAQQTIGKLAKTAYDHFTE